MKTHEHALISLGYAFGTALLTGKGVLDPGIYLSAVVGGELIDLIDHPLFHFVYRRNDINAIDVRRILREQGLKALIAHYNQIEDKRAIRGLLLHNVYSLAILAIVFLLMALFLPSPIYLFVGAGAFLLHMLTDTVGDFLVVGNIDNWLWVISEDLLQRLGGLGLGLVFGVMAFGVVIESCFLLVTARWAWQLSSPAAAAGLVMDPTAFSPHMLAYIPLIVLTVYHVNVIGICMGGVHKYRQELGGGIGLVPFSLGSMRELLRFLTGKSKSFEKTYLRMQADQGPWIIFLAAAITIALMTMTWIWGPSASWKPEWLVIFLLTPVFFALLFGTLIHTTVGEFGGLWGVFSAWLLNLILGHWGLQPLWHVSLGYYVFGSAVVAWIMGLMGGIVLRGQMRMSLVAFSIQVLCKEENVDWLNGVLDLSRLGLQTGYKNAHEMLYGPAGDRKFVTQDPTDLMLTPYLGQPMFGEDAHHYRGLDSYAPLLREQFYVLCDNRLSSASKTVGQFGFIPALPRQRKVGQNPSQGDAYLDGSIYHWRNNKHPVAFKIAGSLEPPDVRNSYWLLFKTWGEYFDHLVTRKDTIRTDLFIYPNLEQPGTATICGLACEYTSTKEFATLEAEAYAGAVFHEICRLVDEKIGIRVGKQAAARIFYPRTSFWDIDLVEWAESSAGLPSTSGILPHSDLEFIRKSLAKLPDQKLITNATMDFRKKLGVLALQYGVAGFIGFLNLDPGLQDLLKKLLGLL